MIYDALIWDCDGCLIDSEIIACRVAAAHLTKAGYAITTREFIHKLAGKGQKQIYAELQAETGVDYQPLVDNDAKRQEMWAAFAEELTAIYGVEAALEEVAALGVAQCVASGSEPERLQYTLGLTGLWPFFNDGLTVFSANQVEKGKPAPDVFLFAAEKLGVAPAKCAVVEDGVAGVKAGKAAGMTVFGFVGSSHGDEVLAEMLRGAGADVVFRDMGELKGLMNKELKRG